MAAEIDWEAKMREFLASGGITVDGAEAPVDEKAAEEVKEAVKEYVGEHFTVPDPPNASQFYIDKSVWKAVCYAIHNNKNLLLLGPTGCGKTETAIFAAKAFERQCYTFNFGGTQEARLSLIGKTTNKPSQGVTFMPSPFLTSVQKDNSVHIWDELSRASTDAMNIVMPLLDRQRQIVVDEQETGKDADWIVRRSDSLAVVATANVGFEYVGASKIDLALLNRFDMTIYIDFPPEAAEKKILIGRTKIAATVAEKLVKAATQQRDAWRTEDFSSAISTRQLLAAADAIKQGVEVNDAVLYCIQSAFSNSGAESEHSKVGQIFQRHLGK